MPFIGSAIDLNCVPLCSHGPVGRPPRLDASPEVNRPQAGDYNIYGVDLDLRTQCGLDFRASF
jgi:hypothetical protein